MASRTIFIRGNTGRGLASKAGFRETLFEFALFFCRFGFERFGKRGVAFSSILVIASPRDSDGVGLSRPGFSFRPSVLRRGMTRDVSMSMIHQAPAAKAPKIAIGIRVDISNARTNTVLDLYVDDFLDHERTDDLHHDREHQHLSCPWVVEQRHRVFVVELQHDPEQHGRQRQSTMPDKRPSPVSAWICPKILNRSRISCRFCRGFLPSHHPFGVVAQRPWQRT